MFIQKIKKYLRNDNNVMIKRLNDMIETFPADIVEIDSDEVQDRLRIHLKDNLSDFMSKVYVSKYVCDNSILFDIINMIVNTDGEYDIELDYKNGFGSNWMALMNPYDLNNSPLDITLCLTYCYKKRKIIFYSLLTEKKESYQPLIEKYLTYRHDKYLQSHKKDYNKLSTIKKISTKYISHNVFPLQHIDEDE